MILGVLTNDTDPAITDRVNGNRERYCQKHPGTFHHLQQDITAKNAVWQKVYTAGELLEKYDWIWLLDAKDALIMNGDVDLRVLVGNLLLQQQQQEEHRKRDFTEIDVIVSLDWNGINAGSFFLRGSEWVKNTFLQSWLEDEGTEHRWQEQQVLVWMVEQDRVNVTRHLLQVPPDQQCLFNAYLKGPEPLFRPGDFVLHNAGYGVEELYAYVEENGLQEHKMTLQTFLAAHAITTPNVRFNRSNESIDKGYGLFANKDLVLETVVATIPATALLNAKTILSLSETDAILGESLSHIDSHNERVVILVALLRLKFGSPLSFTDYISVLPAVDTLDTPVFFSGEAKERSLLAGTGVDVATDAKLGRLQREYFELREALRVLDPTKDLNVPDDEELPVITLEAWMWADAVFWSRVISFKSAAESTENDESGTPDFNMVPLIDFANHSETPEMHWRIATDGSISLVTTSDATVLKDTELHISYGEKSNAELLFIHGFTLQNNKNDSIAFPPPIIEAYGETEQEFNVFQEKLVLIKSLALGPNILLLPSVESPSATGSTTSDIESILSSTSNIISQDSLLTLLLSVASPLDFSVPLLDFSSKQDLWTLFLEHPLLSVILLRVWTVLLNVVEERLTELTQSESSPRDPEGETEEEERSQRVHFVTILREGHYEILGNAYEILTKLQAEYAEKEDVAKYLAEMNLEGPLQE
ncbi:UNVERIFIED_CONTAM: hypothetical protein HDU68_005358 [Siphonaria sp. JEL0065]|nr:hypothetical protein HDU68_005358 [Siphonaria sp. JEL0065]